MWRKLAIIVAALGFALPGSAQFIRTVADPGHYRGIETDANLNALKAILKEPESKIDLARAKLTIDRMIDPSVDIEQTLRQLDAMAKEVRSLYPANASEPVVVETLRAYLYGPDPEHTSPFSYDLSDPLGHKIENKLLPTYLRIKKGNCVSMPTLFIILGQKLGLNVSLAMSPEHLFVRYRDAEGRVLNLETTSGGFPRKESSYQRDTPMTAEALKNGVYMRALTKKEAVVALAETLAEHYVAKNQEPRAIAVANLSLEYFPNHVHSMLRKGYAYHRIWKRNFADVYARPKDIPPELLPYAVDLEGKINFWTNKAEALGWREPDDSQKERTLKIVETVRSKQ